MFSWIETKPHKTPEQEEAQEEAIRLLTKAQQLLMEDEKNVKEAEKLRFEVTNHLLPPKHLFILAKHPRSLLKDVDKRIHRAYYRLTQDEMLREFLTPEEQPIQKKNTVVLNSSKPLSNRTISAMYSGQQRDWMEWLVIIGGILFVAGLILLLYHQA